MLAKSESTSERKGRGNIGSAGLQSIDAGPPRDDDDEPVVVVFKEVKAAGEKSMSAARLPRGAPPPKSPRGRPDPSPTRLSKPPRRPLSRIPDASKLSDESCGRCRLGRGATGNVLFWEAAELDPSDENRSDQAEPSVLGAAAEDEGNSSGALTSAAPSPAPRSPKPLMPRPPMALPVPQRPMSRIDDVEGATVTPVPAAAATGSAGAEAPLTATGPESGRDGVDAMRPPRGAPSPSPIGVGFNIPPAVEVGPAPGPNFGTNSFALTDNSTAPFENVSSGTPSISAWSDAEVAVAAATVVKSNDTTGDMFLLFAPLP